MRAKHSFGPARGDAGIAGTGSSYSPQENESNLNASDQNPAHDLGTLQAGGSVGSVAAQTSENFDSDVESEPPEAIATRLSRLPGPMYIGAKRVFDIVVSLAALAVFGLFLPMIALIIKLDSPGPVFYTQQRVGVNRRRDRSGTDKSERRKVLQPGRPFNVIKLRTMRTNAEAGGPQLARENDVRITRVGRFLRKTRIDEIPQFLNVLKGEMSLIGPRPERLVFVRQLEKEIPGYRDRLLVPPGITGLAQVINGYDDGLESVRRKVELDRKYIESAGFRQDGRILWSTVGVVLKGEGAR